VAAAAVQNFADLSRVAHEAIILASTPTFPNRARQRFQERDERLLLFDREMQRVNLAVDAGILAPV
jgi:hypothetical protein